MTMRWYARPDTTPQKLGLVPRFYRQDVEALLTGERVVEAPWALRFDVGIPTEQDLLERTKLEHDAYLLASRLRDPGLVSVWYTKEHNQQSFVQIESARDAEEAPSGVLVADVTISATGVRYPDQIYAAVASTAQIPPGPVRLELSFVLGPSRNWVDLWKPTIAALDPLLGRTEPERPWHPLTGRVIELGMHLSVDPSAGNKVAVGIAASPARMDDKHTRQLLRNAARTHGWDVEIDTGPYTHDIYVLPDSKKKVMVYWAASGGVLMADGTDGVKSTFIARGEPERTERVLGALTSRSALFTPDPRMKNRCPHCMRWHEGDCPRMKPLGPSLEPRRLS